jgi:HD superfamily phosphodiesterase
MSLGKIKSQIKQECEKSKSIPDWFYKDHLSQVEKNAKEILREQTKADKEVVLLGVWLHDLQRIRGIKGDHQKIGAREAEKVMKEYDYDKEMIEKVKSIILSHSCNSKKPSSLEGKILASADAVSHYQNDFYLKIALTGQRDLKEYKAWLKEKLNRNYNKKLYFVSAKKKIKERHDLFVKLISMK